MEEDWNIEEEKTSNKMLKWYIKFNKLQIEFWEINKEEKTISNEEAKTMMLANGIEDMDTIDDIIKMYGEIIESMEKEVE
jgi:hypothetical protein